MHDLFQDYVKSLQEYNAMSDESRILKEVLYTSYRRGEHQADFHLFWDEYLSEDLFLYYVLEKFSIRSHRYGLNNDFTRFERFYKKLNAEKILGKILPDGE